MITIIGAGMAGLLAGRILKGMGETAVRLIEKQPALPNNHSAVLRFRSPVVGDILGIPFTKVKVMKGYVPWRNPVADNLAYARKATGIDRVDRSITSTGMELVDRWIAPDDLVSRMAAGLNIQYGCDATLSLTNAAFAKSPVISTIPMPILMKSLDYPAADPEAFGTVHGWTVTQELAKTAAYASLYVPDPALSFSRVSLTDDRLIIEFPCPGEAKEDIAQEITLSDVTEIVDAALGLLGMDADRLVGPPETKLQLFAKILPIPDRVRKSFMFWATDQYNIFSLGRFATWRPTLLMDDLVQDVRLISKMMDDRYSIAKLRSAG